MKLIIITSFFVLITTSKVSATFLDSPRKCRFLLMKAVGVATKLNKKARIALLKRYVSSLSSNGKSDRDFKTLQSIYAYLQSSNSLNLDELKAFIELFSKMSTNGGFPEILTNEINGTIDTLSNRNHQFYSKLFSGNSDSPQGEKKYATSTNTPSFFLIQALRKFNPKGEVDLIKAQARIKTAFSEIREDIYRSDEWLMANDTNRAQSYIQDYDSNDFEIEIARGEIAFIKSKPDRLAVQYYGAREYLLTKSNISLGPIDELDYIVHSELLTSNITQVIKLLNKHGSKLSAEEILAFIKYFSNELPLSRVDSLSKSPAILRLSRISGFDEKKLFRKGYTDQRFTHASLPRIIDALIKIAQNSSYTKEQAEQILTNFNEKIVPQLMSDRFIFSGQRIATENQFYYSYYPHEMEHLIELVNNAFRSI